ncbi:hypothetical protein FPOA_00096 [Fusarium poae]|uniref:Uncharacterized protein n=1 Tax=Fusarium poae TaxID=36050 RepID=A0A1B8B0A1_FUSPO|nr:hypothetical protein FPOA_00096 [Fusarium poae]
MSTLVAQHGFSGSIYHATRECILSLEACLSLKALMKDGWAENRLADMNLWASGVGALAKPYASLDRRLEFQPKPRLVLTSLLLSLHKIIENCRENVLYENRDVCHADILEPRDLSPSPTKDSLATVVPSEEDNATSSASWFLALGKKLDDDTDDSGDSDTESESVKQNAEPPFKKVMRDIDDILDQLIMLGFAIRKSGTVARLKKADSSFNRKENEDLRKHLEFILFNTLTKRRKDDEENVENTTEQRLKEVKNGLGDVTPEQQHLILANLRRRHRFRYAKQHQQKLGQHMVQFPIPKSEPIELAVGERDSRSTKNSDVQESPHSKDTPGIKSPNSLIDSQSAELSATAPSAVEGDVLKMTTPSQVAASRVSVSVKTMPYPSAPPIPDQAKGFKCPCCYQTLPGMFRDTTRWRKHLTEDLCPYTCPFPECTKAEVLYISRETWRNHILQSHGMGFYWECSVCLGTENSVFTTAEEFASHNREKHKDTISEHDIPYMQESCRKIAPPNIVQCPLCSWPRDQEVEPDAAANLEHVGNCIHEFSLRALPWAESLPSADSVMVESARKDVELWLDKSTAEDTDVEDIRKVDITNFSFFPSITKYIEDWNIYNPGEYFAESSKATSQVEGVSMSLDSELPEVRGTCSDDEHDSIKPGAESGTVEWGNDERVSWLNLPDYSTSLERARDKRHPGTGDWFIDSKEFASWQGHPTFLLWLQGGPGVGKTILSSFIIDNLWESDAKVLFFFFESKSYTIDIPIHSNKTSFDSMIRSLIHQLHRIQGGYGDEEDLFKLFQNGTRKPETEEFIFHFKSILSRRIPIWIVLDAIDECNDLHDLLNWIKDLFEYTRLGLYVLVTSREDAEIGARIKECNKAHQVVNISAERMQSDIEPFITNRLEEISSRDDGDDGVANKMQESSKAESSGMFRRLASEIATSEQYDSIKEVNEDLQTFSTESSYNEMPKDGTEKERNTEETVISTNELGSEESELRIPQNFIQQIVVLGPDVHMELIDVVHGSIAPDSDELATILVLQFRFTPDRTGRRAPRVTIELDFGDFLGDILSGPPKVDGISFHGNYNVSSTEEIVSSTKGIEGNINSNASLGAGVGTSLGWEKTISRENYSATTIEGMIEVDRFGAETTAKWVLLENVALKTGILSSIQIAVRLKRKSKLAFSCRPKLTFNTNQRDSLQDLFDTLDGNSFLLDPETPPRNKLMDYDTEELGAIDLDRLSSVAKTTLSGTR